MGAANAKHENCTQVSEELIERYQRDPAKFNSQLVIRDEMAIASIVLF